MTPRRERNLSSQFRRYVVNGIVATAVNFAVLALCVDALGVRPVLLAAFAASACGIASSFAGNRWFVFRQRERALLPQATRFVALYAATALLHAAMLAVWSDLLALDYRWGFLLATGVQFVAGYAGNRVLVFKGEAVS
jgi:putative flippase GtrA